MLNLTKSNQNTWSLRIGVALADKMVLQGGSGALLMQMKRQALIESIEPVFAAWQRPGYFVSDAVKREILRLG